MGRSFHALVRDLHYYGGLFVSPFVVVFAVSVIFLVHTGLAKRDVADTTREVEGLQIPANLHNLSGRPLIDALRPVLNQAKVSGEVGWVQHSGNRYVLPVSVPGKLSTVTLQTDTARASIKEHSTGLADAVIELHKSPGPHLVGLRMNWLPMRIWGWLADATVYLLLLTTITGVYLWYTIRSDRNAGWWSFVVGALMVLGIIYGLVA